MPGVNAHLGQAEHNLKLYDQLDKKSFSDWAATALFYSALHYVDAFIFKTLNANPSGHANRDQYLNRIAELKKIRPAYRTLKDSCHNARYVPPTRFTAEELTEMRHNDLESIVTQLKVAFDAP